MTSARKAATIGTDIPAAIPALMRFLLILVLVLAAPAHADEVSPEQLEALRERIERLQRNMDQDREKRDRVRDKLRRTEKRIGDLGTEVRRLDKRREQARDRLERLTERRDERAAEKKEQIQWLARTARASYMSGRQPGLKLLLNQQDPERLSRLLRYQDYFQKSRGERVEVLNRDLEELRELTRKVEQTREELAQRRQALEERRASLEDARDERRQVLAKVTRELGREREKLSRLREDEQRLQGLLDDMSRPMDDIPTEPGGRPFDELTNELPWPVPGDARVDYGDPRQGSMRWKGVVLEAEAGESVRAIQGGRVVYADWLRGYGLLTIVDHGDDYLSLYGYNQSLIRDVGEWVSTGDELALAGDSGGRERTGVYFEIRHQGEPVDPNRWCNRRVTLPPLAEE